MGDWRCAPSVIPAPNPSPLRSPTVIPAPPIVIPAQAGTHLAPTPPSPIHPSPLPGGRLGGGWNAASGATTFRCSGFFFPAVQGRSGQPPYLVGTFGGVQICSGLFGFVQGCSGRDRGGWTRWKCGAGWRAGRWTWIALSFF